MPDQALGHDDRLDEMHQIVPAFVPVLDRGLAPNGWRATIAPVVPSQMAS